MNHEKFISSIEKVFGKYGIDEKKLVIAFISKNVPQDELTDLFGRVMLEVDTAFKRPPSIKTLNELIPNKGMSVEARARQAWITACKYSKQYTDVIFDDPAIHYAIIQAGGWGEFCVRTKDDIWWQKRFIASYIIFVDEGLQVEHIPFRGELDENRLVMVGNEEKCKLLLEGQVQPKQLENNPFLKKIEGGIE